MAPPTLAVVIGVTRYFHQGIVPLPAAQVDAVHFARALHHWGVDEAGIFLLLNEEATLERVEAVFINYNCLNKSINCFSTLVGMVIEREDLLPVRSCFFMTVLSKNKSAGMH